MADQVVDENQQRMEEIKENLEIASKPEQKRLKLDQKDPIIDCSLEERLNGILCCVVCLDLPNLTFYQCTNGHLLCVSCLSHMVADSKMKDESATCPTCRCEVSLSQCSRNRVVEKAISELPTACPYCQKQLPRVSLSIHKREICQDRPVQCNYASVGCEWTGKFCVRYTHDASCAYPQKTGRELIEPVRQLEEEKAKEVRVFRQFLDMLSYANVTFVDLKLQPYRTEEGNASLYYETNRFSAHGFQWTVKARVNGNNNVNQDNSTSAANNTISYQLSLKTKPQNIVRLSFIVLRGPFNDVNLVTVLNEFVFSNEAMESSFVELPVPDYTQINGLLAAKNINMRLVLIQGKK